METASRQPEEADSSTNQYGVKIHTGDHKLVDDE